MKRLIRNSVIFGMANLNPRKSGLPVIIWADHGGVERQVEHNGPRVKIGNNDYSATVSISSNPEILGMLGHIKHSELKNIEAGMEYVARNADLFLKHFNDTTFDFDDEDLTNALRARGEYR